MSVIRIHHRLLHSIMPNASHKVKCFRVTRKLTSARISNDAIDQALRYAKATLAIEGQFVSPEAEYIVRRRIKRAISHEEFKKLALDLALKR
ncbi:MAG: hypothetical protein K6T83_04005 [Alicyclobacillus sp.]|nr:hypothetical protein [Alicyclobacillus sp.]